MDQVKINAPIFRGIVKGGSAGDGRYAYIVLRLGEHDQEILVERNQVGVVMLGLATAASAARLNWIAAHPKDYQSQGLETAYALNVKNADVLPSSDPGTAILNLGIDAGSSGEMDLFLAAGIPALESLGVACAKAIEILNNPKFAIRKN